MSTVGIATMAANPAIVLALHAVSAARVQVRVLPRLAPHVRAALEMGALGEDEPSERLARELLRPARPGDGGGGGGGGGDDAASALETTALAGVARHVVPAVWAAAQYEGLAAVLEVWWRTGVPPAHMRASRAPAGLSEWRAAEAHAGARRAARLVPALPRSAAEVLRALGPWGTLRALGMRRTRLSTLGAPPTPRALVWTFCAPHRAGSALSVGARALAKHCHRAPGVGARFWLTDGSAQLCGSERSKNAQAAAALSRVLRGVSWANAHVLPAAAHAGPEGGTEAERWVAAVVFELRCESGHGARWSRAGGGLADASGGRGVEAAAAAAESGAPDESGTGWLFRGFLEPQPTWAAAPAAAPAAEQH